MKRIILGLGVLLMLAQNGFAKTDAEYDKLIEQESDKTWKQMYRCMKASGENSMYTASVNTCLKAISMVDKNRYVLKEGAAEHIQYTNAGILYQYSEKNYMKAYEYYMKSAKLGSTNAQSNLDILCSEHSWVCK